MESPRMNSIEDSALWAMALPLVSHQSMGLLLPAPCLGEGGSCGFLLPFSNASRPVWTYMSPSFRSHRETEHTHRHIPESFGFLIVLEIGMRNGGHGKQGDHKW